MLCYSYDAPEILQRLLDTPADPEYNKFTQQVFVKPDVQGCSWYCSANNTRIKKMLRLSKTNNTRKTNNMRVKNEQYQ